MQAQRCSEHGMTHTCIAALQALHRRAASNCKRQQQGGQCPQTPVEPFGRPCYSPALKRSGLVTSCDSRPPSTTLLTLICILTSSHESPWALAAYASQMAAAPSQVDATAFHPTFQVHFRSLLLRS